MLTPMDIHNYEFKRGFRGYSEKEVDDFLDRVVNDFEKLLRENDKLKEQANMNEKQIEYYKNLEKNLQDTLTIAQKTADEVINSAKKNAAELKENATRESKILHDNAVADAKNIREQAKLDAKRLSDETNHKLRSVIAEYDRILREKNSFLLKMRTALEAELAVTLQLMNSVPQPTESPVTPEVQKVDTEKNVFHDLPEEKNLSVEKNLPEEKVEPQEEKKFTEEDLDKTMTFTPIRK